MPYQRQKTDYLAEKFTPDKKEIGEKGKKQKKDSTQLPECSL